MFEDPSNPTTLRPQELEAVYEISRAVARAVDMDAALDEIIRLARPVFIFDNMVLYTRRGVDSLEPSYARAIGRGRSYEAQLTWGEPTAYEAINTGQVVIRREELDNYSIEDRIRIRYNLGLPILLGQDAKGALVFIRFGGPTYKPDQIRLAEFIAVHVAQLFEHDQLVQKVVSLEAERRLDRLQEDFIATVSHELLTPLGFIKGYATTLLREDASWDDSTRGEFLTIIDEEADRLHELIENLMDSSRLQAGTLRMSFQPVRLDTFLKDISMRAKSRDENQDIDLEIKAPGLQVPVDPTRLAQVFDNLLTNAAKYAPGAKIRITLEEKEDSAYIDVSDNGPGIAPEHVTLLFKRFYRVPSNNTTVRGTGLGLFICRQIVRAHSGEIEVESKLGEGTTFHICLPLNPEKIQEHMSLREGNP
jgi:signal transduction histidine kinase